MDNRICVSGGWLHDISRLILALFLLVLSFFVQDAMAGAVAYFPNMNTVPIKGGLGSTATVNNVISINKAARTAEAVVSYKDKLGNPLLRRVTLAFSPEKLRVYATICMRSPVACAAAGTAIAAVISADYALDPLTGVVTLPYSPTGECLTKTLPLPDSSGVTRYTLGAFPCSDTRFTNKTTYQTISPSDKALEWDTDGIAVQQPNVWVHTQTDTANAVLATIYIYSKNKAYSDPHTLPNTGGSEISDLEYADLMLSNPLNLQPELASFADVFEELDVEEEPALDPETDLSDNLAWVGGDPEKEELLVFDDVIDTNYIDISDFYQDGVSSSGWLPKSCPEDLPLDVGFGVLNFSYDMACTAISNYVSPFIKISSLFSFVFIVFAGIKS